MTSAAEPDAELGYHRLLTAVRRLVRCDAAALLRLDGACLVPVAVDGLSDDALGRRFVVEAHPRLARILASGDGVRFPPGDPLPDPYDGLVDGQPDILPVHDCMGTPLNCRGRIWGVLTLDALAPGAFDAVQPAHLRSLAEVVERGLEAEETIRELQARTQRAQAVARALAGSGSRELSGASAAMQQLRREVDLVAASDLTALILGETGVGKELVAERLHARSRRRDQPLVRVNCAALPDTLADSELFGHRRGAFTGAVSDRSGKFELADQGTLLLDEVGELPLPVQAKLLRVLQSGELQRPGSDAVRHVDVRLIAATNRDLAAEVAQGRFRADLYHRLSVYPLWVPPLRARGRDVLALAGGFLEENQQRLGARNLRLTPASKALLLQQAWPGNVRELEHLIGRAALRAHAEAGKGGRWIGIEPWHLGLEGEAAGAPRSVGVAAASGQTLRVATEAFQRQWLRQLLQRHAGSMPAAAEEAGMDRSNFHRLTRRLGVSTAAPRRKT
jgi:anaerobic nitric oxide reductase transcription regulator